jgi:hypothetical protein
MKLLLDKVYVQSNGWRVQGDEFEHINNMTEDFANDWLTMNKEIELMKAELVILIYNKQNRIKLINKLGYALNTTLLAERDGAADWVCGNSAYQEYIQWKKVEED